VLRGGIRVTRLERSVVDSVRQVPTDRRRTPFIEAVARRMTTPERLRTAVESTPNLPDRLMLLRLTSLLALGCRSELELCGYDHVFRGLPDLRRQVPIRAGRRTVYLDIYAEPERVNFELDGAGYHSAPIDRERDLQRDAALGALGIMVVRFTHRRLTTDPASVRREALAILAARRRAA
jgi:very-short-patch-repair endonuclease